jgi:hypothetical protein
VKRRVGRRSEEAARRRKRTRTRDVGEEKKARNASPGGRAPKKKIQNKKIAYVSFERDPTPIVESEHDGVRLKSAPSFFVFLGERGFMNPERAHEEPDFFFVRNFGAFEFPALSGWRRISGDDSGEGPAFGIGICGGFGFHERSDSGIFVSFFCDRIRRF